MKTPMIALGSFCTPLPYMVGLLCFAATYILVDLTIYPRPMEDLWKPSPNWETWVIAVSGGIIGFAAVLTFLILYKRKLPRTGQLYASSDDTEISI